MTLLMELLKMDDLSLTFPVPVAAHRPLSDLVATACGITEASSSREADRMLPDLVEVVEELRSALSTLEPSSRYDAFTQSPKAEEKFVPLTPPPSSGPPSFPTGVARPLDEVLRNQAERKTTRALSSVLLTSDEAKALAEVLDQLFARATPEGSMVEESVQNAFRWDGSDTLNDTTTRALFKLLTAANEPVPTNLRLQAGVGNHQAGT